MYKDYCDIRIYKIIVFISYRHGVAAVQTIKEEDKDIPVANNGVVLTDDGNAITLMYLYDYLNTLNSNNPHIPILLIIMIVLNYVF